MTTEELLRRALHGSHWQHPELPPESIELVKYRLKLLRGPEAEDAARRFAKLYAEATR